MIGKFAAPSMDGRFANRNRTFAATILNGRFGSIPAFEETRFRHRRTSGCGYSRTFQAPSPHVCFTAGTGHSSADGRNSTSKEIVEAVRLTRTHRAIEVSSYLRPRRKQWHSILPSGSPELWTTATRLPTTIRAAKAPPVQYADFLVSGVMVEPST